VGAAGQAPAPVDQVPLEAEDNLAVEAAVAEFFAHLAYVFRLNSGVNARSDRAIREHARNLCQHWRSAAGHVDEAAVVALERDRHHGGGPVPVLGHDQVGLPGTR
jgi:hypothetical protein